jgi:hypothetical protein
MGFAEGWYWHYESFLKQLDAGFYSVVGAAGELFALRTELFTELPNDTLLDDLALSLEVSFRGYRIAYEPAGLCNGGTIGFACERTAQKGAYRCRCIPAFIASALAPVFEFQAARFPVFCASLDALGILPAGLATVIYTEPRAGT